MRTIVFIIILTIMLSGCELIEVIDSRYDNTYQPPAKTTQTTPTGAVTTQVTSVIRDNGLINVHFCPQENCTRYWIDFADQAERTLHCALYELNEPNIKDFLERKQNEVDLQVVIDDDSENDTKVNLVIDKGSALMHNKFCVIDDSYLVTGSMNPTVNDATKNNNNLLLIHSEKIAALYEQEFDELWNKKRNNKTETSPFIFNTTQITIYFCPEDECADKIIKELQKAEKEIYFMTFSFTHTGITNEILLKHNNSVEVKGVFERRQNSDYSPYDTFLYQGMDVYLDANKNTMHHKVFIIDNETVTTGSMNPTKNGNENNDENLLIIKDKEIASLFLKEFEKVWDGAKEAEENKTKT